MSADNGWVIRKNQDAKFVLQHYFASDDELPPLDQNAGEFDTLEEAVLKYNELEDEDYPSEYGLTLQINKQGDK